MIYDRYVDKNGYSIDKISEHPFPITYKPDNHLFIENKEDTVKYFCAEYFQEMEAREWMERVDSNFYLTAKGFMEGYKIKHPIRYFWQVHWKWGVATGIAVLGFISTAIYRYGT